MLVSKVEARKIRDRPMLELLRVIADSGRGLYQSPETRSFLGLPERFPGPTCGLPIGNLTSQWWGNHYLSGLDHYVKRVLKIRHYQRYMDDFVLLGHDPHQLEQAREAISDWLWQHRRLQLKHPNAPVQPTAKPTTHLGHRVSRAGIAPTKAALRRMQLRITDLVLRGDAEQIERSLASYRGILRLRGC